MRKIIKYLLLLPLIAGAFSVSSRINERKPAEVSADSVRPYPYSGGESSIIFVSGGMFSKDYPVAIYVWNDRGSAWSNKCDYTIDGAYPVVLPPTNGANWSKFIVTKYNKYYEPSSDSFNGVAKQSGDQSISMFMARSQNLIYVSENESGISVSETLGYKEFYGVRGDTHFYLDLKDNSNWREANAKYAIYFAHSNNFNKKEDWSLSNSSDGYYLSHMWKVTGQSNENLYECIVPGGSSTLWNLAIAVRFDPVQAYPGWYNVWNQTDDINFNSSNHTANMIYINSSGNGEIYPEHAISKETRLNFFGQYLLDTISCSGNGNSDATTNEQWNAVKAEYKTHLSTSFQGGVWTAIADKTGNTLAQAIYRYDYILFYKHYEHEDFINRADPNSGYQPLSSNEYISAIYTPTDNKKLAMYIVIISLVSISSVGLLLVVKRKKTMQ